MKKSICFYFQIHIPYQLRRFRFFDIGNSHNYYDEFNTRAYLQQIAIQCYLPMNKVLLDIIKEHGKDFKVAFSITGETLDQFEKYAPNVLESFKELAKTGCVEFLCETYSHSLVFLKDEAELNRQLQKQCQAIKQHFGQEPSVVRLTGLIYSDQIGERVAKLGFNGMITEGAKHMLGWKSPNYLYTNANTDKLKILLRNYQLSNNIAYRFSDTSWSEWPLTCEKFVNSLNQQDPNEEVTNIFMDYLTFGSRHHKSSGIFEFIRYLPSEILKTGNFEFSTPSEVIKKFKPVAPIHVPYPISWSEEERDLSIWLGNDLQVDAYDSLCELGNCVRFLNNKEIMRDWEWLQDSDHFYYMSTKWMSANKARRFKNVYPSPYEAYINYMNVLSDLKLRVNNAFDAKMVPLLKDKVYANEIMDAVSIPKSFTLPQMNKLIRFIHKGSKTGPIKTKSRAVNKSKEVHDLDKASKPVNNKVLPGNALSVIKGN